MAGIVNDSTPSTVKPFADSAADPATNPSEAQLYTKGGKFYAIDKSGNVTQLSGLGSMDVKYAGIAATKLNTSALAQVWATDYTDATRFTTSQTTGTVALSTVDNGGVYQLSAGTPASSDSNVRSSTTNFPTPIRNMQLPWFFATRIRLPLGTTMSNGFRGQNTLQNGTNGFGLAANVTAGTTFFTLGRFDGNFAPSGTVASATSFASVGTTFFEAYAYCDGTSMKASVNGEPDVTVFGVGSIAAASATLYTTEIFNNNAKSVVDSMDVDWTGIWTTRST